MAEYDIALACFAAADLALVLAIIFAAIAVALFIKFRIARIYVALSERRREKDDENPPLIMDDAAPDETMLLR